MKRGKILNSELSHALASLGHGDLMIVCDAGFPIPSDVWRIDLAIVQDVPDLETVLTALSEAFIAEKVSYAAEMAENNPPLLEKITLHEAIEKIYGLPTIFNQEMFSAVPAPKEVAALLGALAGSPMLRIEMLSFTYKEKPYEYRISYCVTNGLKMFREM